MFLARKPGLRYVHRGTLVAWDYNQSTLIQDGAWHTLDLSAIIPANAKLVDLGLGASASAAGCYFRVMKTGAMSGYGAVNVIPQVPNIIIDTEAIVDCTGQQVDYLISEAVFTTLRFCVIGWFL